MFAIYICMGNVWSQECTSEKHTQENIVRNNNARKKWSQKQEIIIIDSAHEKLVRGTQTNLARPVVSSTFYKLLAKEKPSHRFHPVGEIFLLRVVAAFSFLGGACLLLMLGTSGWQLAYGR